MEQKPYYRTRLRPKGQLTIPSEVRQSLGVREGDDLAFYLNDQGQMVVARLQVIPPDQAWFWSERWQQMERQVDAEIAAGQLREFENIQDFIRYLDEPEDAQDPV